MATISPTEARVGSWYVVGVWDPQEPSVVGHQVTGRLVSKRVKLKRYPGDEFWLMEGFWITHLVPKNLIQQVDTYKQWNL